ncbi:MAG: NAD(P)-dependent oxidoreductase [Candidatus Nanoarchaeia archaeon]
MKEKWEIDYMKKSLKNHQLYFFDGELNKDNVDRVKDFDIISVFIYSGIDKTLIPRLRKVKAIITRSTGFDHIDLKTCSTSKIKVYNIPRYGSNTVAEFTFALILSLTRKIIKSNERVRELNFDLDGLRGMDLKGKTIGIVGLGEIGTNVVEIAKGFKMNVIVNTTTKDNSLSKKLGFKYVNFNTLLKNSDVITFHVPLLPSTTHMINRKNINLIKKGAYLVNTSRGEVVETEAIIKALDKKILSGVGLDVLEEEELIRDEKDLLLKEHSREELKSALEENVLLEQDNVVITPHNAFNTQEALERILDITVDNINSAINNRSDNLVKCD